MRPSSTPNLAITSSRSVGHRIATNTGLMVGSQALAVLLGFGSIFVAINALDSAELGIILFLHAYMLFFAQVATFQAWQPIIRYGMDEIRNEDAPGLARLLQFGYKLDIVSAIFAFGAAVGCFSLVVWIAESFPELFAKDGQSVDVRTLFGWVVAYCTLVLLRHRGASIGVFRLFDRFDILAWHGLIMPAVRFIGVIIAAMTGAGMEGFLLAWFLGSLADYIALPVLAAFQLHKRHLLGAVVRAKSSFRRPGQGVWPFVIKANVDATLAAANMHLPVLLVMAVFGSTWVAVFKLADEVAKLLSEGFKLLDQVIYPELAKMVSMGEAAKIWKLVTRTAVLLLGFGLIVSVVLWLFLGGWIGAVMPPEYMEAAPLAALLVPAAAFLGMAAPLYPVLYATDTPERAIYARGAGVIVYIAAFFALSFTIGKLAPGWAAILANLIAVGLLLFLAKQALNTIVARENGTLEDVQPAPGYGFIGESDKRIWGLPLGDWQARAFKKAGGDPNNQLASEEKGIWHHVHWVLSAELSKSFALTQRTALVEHGQTVSLSSATREEAERYIGQSPEALSETDFRVSRPDEINDGYIKSLRKQEQPYALDMRETEVLDVMKRQFDSSYKGITDFVTKWFWPVPAFYVTRLCAWLRLTPNQVTTIGFVLMLMATYYFWNAQWLLGFLCGWTMTFLDTVDGKLARTTMTYSSWGNVYDHGIDLIHPPFWYLAWFVGLGGAFATSDVLFLALLAICVGYVVDRLIEGVFLAQHGFHIHVWTKFNSWLRFFIARRNPNTFIFMLGILASVIWPEAGKWAFLIIALWTWVCIAANILTVIAGTIAKGPLSSWMDA